MLVAWLEVCKLAIINMHTHSHSITNPSGDQSVSFTWTKIARPCFLLENNPVRVKCGITSWSALVQYVCCRRITRALYLVAHWLAMQIFLALRPSMFSCNIMGTVGPHLPSVDLPVLFTFTSGVMVLFFYLLGSTPNSSPFLWLRASFQDW